MVISKSWLQQPQRSSVKSCTNLETLTRKKTRSSVSADSASAPFRLTFIFLCVIGSVLKRLAEIKAVIAAVKC